MSRINILDSQTANAIKAGEVIERPVNVVKELIDNSIDAGASAITVEFSAGGISYIRVTDNGIGMDPEDARKSFLLHATSKIRNIEDIYDLTTQGFRGEALASVASCSDVEIRTKTADSDVGTCVRYKDGSEISCGECATDNGTVVTVRDLFSNIPARYKFLKKDSTEGMYICSVTEKLAIVNPHITFKLIKDERVVFVTPGNGNMKDTIFSLYGKQITDNLIEVDCERDGLRLRGYTGKPFFGRGNRSMQYVYVNERCVTNRSVSAAIDEAYRNSLMRGKFPICFLCIMVPPADVDVNVHPQKAEVKFSNESDIFRLVFHGISDVLKETGEAKDAADLVRDTKDIAKPAAASQISYKFTPAGTAAPSKEFTPQDSKVTDDLMRILMGFKPDIDEIEGKKEQKEEQKEPAPQIPSEAAAAAPLSDVEELQTSSFCGIIFDTYIIMQNGESVFLVDQHAAHERVLYEKFLKKRKVLDSEEKNVQELLIPQLIELSPSDLEFIRGNLDRFSENGFDIELMGDRQISLRSIPVADSDAARLKHMDRPEVIFKNVLEDMKRDVPEKGSLWYSLIQTTACKAAIKAHDKISREEAVELVMSLVSLDDPYHCAHGRPTFIKLTDTDLRKRFKRIV